VDLDSKWAASKRSNQAKGSRCEKRIPSPIPGMAAARKFRRDPLNAQLEVGAIGGMLIAEIVGHVLQWTNSYMIPFFIAASAYVIALLLIHTLSPRLEPAVIGQG
jgi:hypothetical protein